MNRFNAEKKKHVLIDLFVLLMLNILFWVSIKDLNVIELIYYFNQNNGHYYLDIVIPLVLITIISLLFYVSRRLIVNKSYTIKIDDQSKRDELTGLRNHKALEGKITREFLRFERYKEVFCILILDIDDFSAVNESKGRPYGDNLLQCIASRLKANTRKVDICCRWEGEQFLILCPVTELSEALVIAEKLRLTIQDPMPDGGIVTASIGVMDMKIDIRLEDIVKIAEVALYKAKIKGKNRICVA